MTFVMLVASEQVGHLISKKGGGGGQSLTSWSTFLFSYAGVGWGDGAYKRTLQRVEVFKKGRTLIDLRGREGRGEEGGSRGKLKTNRFPLAPPPSSPVSVPMKKQRMKKERGGRGGKEKGGGGENKRLS
eukprot:Hpha_TRINITY_DN15902_c0_g1::TRINITY_DN15902_c0_g1_i2::g.71144::m.71144